MKQKPININITPLNNVSSEEVLSFKPIVEIVYIETPSAIERAITEKKDIATLLEINNSGNFVELEKSQWKSALEQCLKKAEEVQDYEKCSYIVGIIKKAESFKVQPKKKQTRVQNEQRRIKRT